MSTVTIGHARIARGYSGYDHLLDDSPLEAMEGRTYASMDAAARDAARRLKGTQDRRCMVSYVVLLDERGTGSTYELP